MKTYTVKSLSDSRVLLDSGEIAEVEDIYWRWFDDPIGIEIIDNETGKPMTAPELGFHL